MKSPPIVPPLKCQGIKTKLVEPIQKAVAEIPFQRWIEPFCGSCVVALNVQPKRALLCDANPHIISLFKEIQDGRFTPALAREYLSEQGSKLSKQGQSFYYEVRERFNQSPTPQDFLFLNRACFNGLIRFNKKGYFNTPYGHKDERFAQAYITKITNQISRFAKVAATRDWVFEQADFRATLAKAGAEDLVYADPPYAGRSVDYYNHWTTNDETDLVSGLNTLPCRFLLSTWHSNEFRKNEAMQQAWANTEFHITLREHFYHVGSSEDLRHPMTEAFVSNFEWADSVSECEPSAQHGLFPGNDDAPSLQH